MGTTGHQRSGVLLGLISATVFAYVGFGVLANSALSDVHPVAASQQTAN